MAACDILRAMLDTTQFAIEITRHTGDLLLKYFRKIDLETHIKWDKSIVTEADMKADRLIVDEIQRQFPGDVILSEEREGITSYQENQDVWIIDPLDGTTNFNLGIQIWGVLITHLKNGFPDSAVMNFPLLGELYYAESGNGAFLNSSRIHVELPNKYRPLSFFACCSRTFHNYSVSVPYKVRILGSAAYSFCSLSRGSAIVAFEATPKIWDIAGAWLLVNEAGGDIDTLDGIKPFPLQSGVAYSKLNFPMLAAPNEKLLEKSKRQIRML